jgi:gas vesicle protein
MREVKRVYYVAVFDDRDDAELAAGDLRKRGFKDDEIGYVWRDDAGKTRQEGNRAGKLAAEGAGAGVVLGGIIGAAAGLLVPGVGPVVAGGILATALAGAVTGAVAGGVAGALVGLGIPESEAKYYDDQFREGRTLVTVKAGDRYDEASEIARRRRGYDYETRNERPMREQEREESDARR